MSKPQTYYAQTVFTAALVAAAVSPLSTYAGPDSRAYTVLDPIVRENLAIFPVAAAFTGKSDSWITLDEGLRTGEVTVAERESIRGLERRYTMPIVTPPFIPEPMIRREMIRPERNPGRGDAAQVNRLVLINHSSRPLLLIAGEIVVGGKQDRVVARDRIVKPDSDPIDLGVFCVEPRRWNGVSQNFGGFNGSLASPSVRLNVMVGKDQQSVWEEVARARQSFAGAGGSADTSSSYAGAAGSARKTIDQVAVPVSESIEKMITGLRDRKAIGVVVAIDGVLVWVDVFANPALFEKYWPKLIRSYAAEALPGRMRRAVYKTPSVNEAKAFLADLKPVRENVESEPGVYRNTEIAGADFAAFSLTALLPNTGYEVHLAKMWLPKIPESRR